MPVKSTNSIPILVIGTVGSPYLSGADLRIGFVDSTDIFP